MGYTGILTAVTAAILLALPASADGIYTKSSPVLQLDARNYDNLLARSNHTSVCRSDYSSFNN